MCQTPNLKSIHPYLFSKPPHSLQKSYKLEYVYRQILRNKQKQIQEQSHKVASITNQIANPTSMIQLTSDEDGDSQMMNQSKVSKSSPILSYSSPNNIYQEYKVNVLYLFFIKFVVYIVIYR